MELHPEKVCRRCGGPNVSWSAPSPLWNAVMRGGSIDGPQEFDELICPTCFAVLAGKRGVASGWRLEAETVRVALEMVTPSGRTWDPLARLWREPITRKRWLITFTNGDRVWTDHCTGTYVEAREYAESLSYQASTRFTVKEATDDR